MSVSTKDLKKTLGKTELFSVAVGQIIGAGIMALTGIAIGMTGRSVNISFILAAVAVIFLSIPIIFITSTVRMRGGQYTQAAKFINQRFAGMYIVVFIITNISLAMYALSFAEYLAAFLPGIPPKVTSIVLITVIFLINFIGIGKAAKLQTIMVVVLTLALVSFIGFGISEVQPGYFEQPDFTTNGIVGVLTAMALLTFATGGATAVVNLSAEAKNPKKDIPFVMIISTLVVAVIYALMATVAAGVLPVDEVANQPLTLVAKEIFPQPIYIFFVVCGAMFALVTTLNSQVGWCTKPIMQACVDGWFPKSLAKLHPKYNTPYKLLIIYYFIGIIPIIIGFNIEQVANMSLVCNYVILIALTIGTFRLPKLFPKQWSKSTFKVNNGIFYATNVVAVVVLLVQLVFIFGSSSMVERVGNIAVFIIAAIFGIIRNNKVNMEISVDDE